MQKITVTTLDGTELVAERILPFDLIGFERRYGVSAATLSESGFFEHLVFLAHHALKRQKTVTEDFETFIKTVAEVNSDNDDDDAEEGGDAAPPTGPDQPTD